MKITILQTGSVHHSLRARFAPYPDMFRKMFEATGHRFSFETVPVLDGAPMPSLDQVEAIVITGSAAGVYDDYVWMDPLRQFIRAAYGRRTPMLGICFGHQIIADALGGDVRKSEKGWGLGRHVYEVRERPGFMGSAPPTLAVACSHQDQVITPPKEAEVILASPFTPNAGLAYKNGAVLSFQPHPEFDDPYTIALAELRRGQVPDALVESALQSVQTPSQARDVAGYIGQFFAQSAA
jgi:GMP synthase-like glutamine amidotransferase